MYMYMYMCVSEEEKALFRVTKILQARDLSFLVYVLIQSPCCDKLYQSLSLFFHSLSLLISLSTCQPSNLKRVCCTKLSRTQ